MNERVRVENAISDASREVGIRISELLGAIYEAKYAGVDAYFLRRHEAALDALIAASEVVKAAMPCSHAVASDCPHFS